MSSSSDPLRDFPVDRVTPTDREPSAPTASPEGAEGHQRADGIDAPDSVPSALPSIPLASHTAGAAGRDGAAAAASRTSAAAALPDEHLANDIWLVAMSVRHYRRIAEHGDSLTKRTHAHNVARAEWNRLLELVRQVTS
jgi:hypothetical protein